ncbi:MAG: type I-G CRISPR-associated protein Cas8g1/Csx17, partial [Armatimonadota bacterium]
SGSVGLLEQVDRDGWLTSLCVIASLKKTPERVKRALHRIQQAIMDVCRHDTPVRWQEVLMALGAAEQAMVRSPRTTASSGLSPVPSLSQGWLRVCDDDSPEFRLALSLASIRAQEKIGPLRANMVPLRQWDSYPRFRIEGSASSRRLKSDPAVVWGHGDLSSNLAAVLMRRCMDSRRLGLDALPLCGTRPARLDDIGAFIYEEIDESKLEDLLWGLNAVWLDREWTAPNYGGVLPAGYSLLKLVHLPHPVKRSPAATPVEIRYDPEVSRLACAGRMLEATGRAAHRLRASGLPVAIEGVPETPEMSRRIAAALLFPVSKEAVAALCDHVLLPHEEEQEEEQAV